MKKFDFKKLALMGITGGVICATQVNSAADDQPKAEMGSMPAAQHVLTESEFAQTLNPESKAIFDKFSPEAKALTLKVANHACKGEADCKGLEGPFKDNNDIVKAVQMKTEESAKEQK